MRAFCVFLIAAAATAHAQQSALPRSPVAPQQGFQLTVSADKPEQLLLSPDYIAKVRGALDAMDQLRFHRRDYGDAQGYMEGQTALDRFTDDLAAKAVTEGEFAVRLIVDGLVLSRRIELLSDAYPELPGVHGPLMSAVACRKLVDDMLTHGRTPLTFGPCNYASTLPRTARKKAGGPHLNP